MTDPNILPHEYDILFNSPTGQVVLEDLVNRFGGQTYVRGGLEAQRETDYRAGRRSVVEHIISMMNRNNGVEPNSTED